MREERWLCFAVWRRFGFVVSELKRDLIINFQQYINIFSIASSRNSLFLFLASTISLLAAHETLPSLASRTDTDSSIGDTLEQYTRYVEEENWIRLIQFRLLLVDSGAALAVCRGRIIEAESWVWRGGGKATKQINFNEFASVEYVCGASWTSP